ncbi:MAG: HupE/UreJ family protein [Rhodospirillales bacterium]|nr:HupE/UreJ family protein [Rhodospirillales bacterium]
MRWMILAAVTALAGFGMAGAAEAHTFGAANAGLAQGLAHPFGGLDHVLAMVAVGLWAVQISARAGARRALWLVPAAFVVMMMVGGVAAFAGVPLPKVEFGILGSLLVLGGLVALAARVPAGLGAAVVGFFAVFHGHAHGVELPEAASALLYTFGFVTATAALHGIGVAAGLYLRGEAGRWLVRMGGAGVAAAGLAMMMAG